MLILLDTANGIFFIFGFIVSLCKRIMSKRNLQKVRLNIFTKFFSYAISPSIQKYLTLDLFVEWMFSSFFLFMLCMYVYIYVDVNAFCTSFCSVSRKKKKTQEN